MDHGHFSRHLIKAQYGRSYTLENANFGHFFGHLWVPIFEKVYIPQISKKCIYRAFCEKPVVILFFT